MHRVKYHTPSPKSRISRSSFAFLILICLLHTACAPSDQASEARKEGLVPIELDKSDPERLLRYYFGSYVSQDGADPFDAGLVVKERGGLYIDSETLASLSPEASNELNDQNGDGVIDWDELVALLQKTYFAARQIPPTLDAFRTSVSYQTEDDAWYRVELDGVMTTARRRIFVEEAWLRRALEGYKTNGDKIIYPVGTTFIGEHLEGDALAETTVMVKRADNFWDYFVYGRMGGLVTATETPPRALKVPTQCVGCHFGSKLFEPEKSFPGSAQPGPHGPRGYHVDSALRNAEVVRFFNEHRKRSDTVLGLYATLFVSQMQVQRAEGTLSEADATLLEELGL